MHDLSLTTSSLSFSQKILCFISQPSCDLRHLQIAEATGIITATYIVARGQLAGNNIERTARYGICEQLFSDVSRYHKRDLMKENP
jgi:hypothetical protein